MIDRCAGCKWEFNDSEEKPCDKCSFNDKDRCCTCFQVAPCSYCTDSYYE